MAGYGDGAYGDGLYKGIAASSDDVLDKPEPVLFVAYENRAFFFSHRSASLTGDREYRMAEFQRYGQTENEFIFGG